VIELHLNAVGSKMTPPIQPTVDESVFKIRSTEKVSPLDIVLVAGETLMLVPAALNLVGIDPQMLRIRTRIPIIHGIAVFILFAFL